MSSFDFNSGQAGQQPSMTPQDTHVKRSTWPQVIGIIGIVLGALGICAHACGILGAFFMKALFAFLAGKANDPTLAKVGDVMTAYTLPTALVGLLGLAMAVWLLIGSIALVRRRPSAAQLGVWGIVQTAAVLGRTAVGAWVAVSMAHDMKKLIAELGATPQGGLPINSDPTLQLIQSVVSGLFLLIFPIFVACWFRRKAIRDEINSWRVPASGAAF